MHDLLCSLVPGDRSARAAAVPLSDPRADRWSPFCALEDDWSETLAFDITVNATTEEGVASRLITGPFRIDEIGFRSSASGGASQLLRVGVGDSSPNPQTLLDTGNGVPVAVATDSARTVGAYYLTTIFERHYLRQTFRTGTARLLYTLNNTTAGAVTIVGHVSITHLRELPRPAGASY